MLHLPSSTLCNQTTALLFTMTMNGKHENHLLERYMLCTNGQYKGTLSELN